MSINQPVEGGGVGRQFVDGLLPRRDGYFVVAQSIQLILTDDAH